MKVLCIDDQLSPMLNNISKPFSRLKDVGGRETTVLGQVSKALIITLIRFPRNRKNQRLFPVLPSSGTKLMNNHFKDKFAEQVVLVEIYPTNLNEKQSRVPKAKS